VTEFLKRHTGWELTELYVAEKYWPTGEPADSQRASMICSILAAGWGDREAAVNAQKIWRKLIGTADPATANKRGMSAAEIKHKISGLM
jgi:hypothetical protein